MKILRILFFCILCLNHFKTLIGQSQIEDGPISIQVRLDSINDLIDQGQWPSYHAQLNKLIRHPDIKKETLDSIFTILQYQLEEKQFLSEAGYVWNFAGKRFTILGEFEEAVPYYEKAASILKEAQDTTYLHLMYYYQSQAVILGVNDPLKALEASTEAIRLYKARRNIDRRTLGKLYYAKGWALRGLKKYDKTIQAFDQSIEMSGDLDGYVETFRCRTFLETNQYEKALSSATLANEKFEKLYNAKNNEYVLLLGRAKANLGDFQAARADLGEAIALGKSSYGEQHSEYIKLFYFLAKIEEQAGAIDQALKHCNTVFNLSYPDFNNQKLGAIPAIKGPSSNLWVLDALILQGQLLLQKSRKEESIALIPNGINSFQQSIIDINTRRAALDSWSSKQDFNRYAFSAYNGAVESSLELHNSKNTDSTALQLLTFIEKSRAILLKSYQKEKAQHEVILNEESRAKLNSIETQIANIEKELYQANGKQEDQKVDSLNQLLIQERLNWNALISPFREQEATVLNTKDQTFPLRRIQSTLKDDKGLLMFYELDSTLISIFITNSSLDIEQLDLTDLKEWVFNYVSALSNWEKIQTDFEAVQESATQLSKRLGELLLSPLTSTDKSKLKQLLIIPHGTLFQIPFETLMLNNRMLIEDFSIHYALSTEQLFNEIPSKNMQLKNFAGFAPEYNAEANLKQSSDIVLRGDLVDLPGTKEAITTLSKIFNGKVWMEGEASKDAFVENAPSYRILHLAMHGKVDEDESKLSKLYFNSDENSGLTLREIQSLKLNSDMVVLSACETNVGTLKKGEGPLSLAYAFQYAGAKSVLSSLWSVPDEQTSKIMVNFYTYLKSGLHKSEALRKAKLEYLETAVGIEKHPSFWAGFIILGEDNPIKKQKNYLPYLILLSVILIFSIFLSKSIGRRTV